MVRDYSLPFPRTHVHIYLRDQTLPDSTANVAALFHGRWREKLESIFNHSFFRSDVAIQKINDNGYVLCFLHDVPGLILHNSSMHAIREEKIIIFYIK